jgi:GTP-binding protein HflX
VCPEVRSESYSRPAPVRLEEITGLAAAISLDIVKAETVPVREMQPATFFGTGRVKEIAATIAAEEIALVVVDHALTPGQQRELEKRWQAKVIDRTGLILEIFGERAATHEGQLQVELASLDYQRSRLVRSWTHLERQRGGFGFLGGPGESQLEIDRRLIAQRIAKIKKELQTVKSTRDIQRQARPYPVVALVGYTNAGKSTLFNRLTKAEVMAADMLFATLDPTIRRIMLPSGWPALISDTVGFISDLPTGLVAAFSATLEEVRQADIILHVRDFSHPESAAQRADVLDILENDLGIAAADDRIIEVMNKIDCVPGFDSSATRAGEGTVYISARDGTGIDMLLGEIDRRLTARRSVVEVEVDLSDGKALAEIYRQGRVLERTDREGTATIRLERQV